MQRPEKDQWVYFPEKVIESPKAYMLFRETRRKRSLGFWVPTRVVMEQLGEKRVRPYFLLPYATDEQTFGLWPVPDAMHDYAISAYNIWRDFNGQWVRIETDQERGRYFAEPSSVSPPTSCTDMASRWLPVDAGSVFRATDDPKHVAFRRGAH